MPPFMAPAARAAKEHLTTNGTLMNTNEDHQIRVYSRGLALRDLYLLWQAMGVGELLFELVEDSKTSHAFGW